MDWTQIVMAWGPSIPIVLFLLKVHRDFVYKIVPGHLRLIRKELHRQERRAAERHREFMQALEALEEKHAREIDAGPRSARKRKASE